MTYTTIAATVGADQNDIWGESPRVMSLGYRAILRLEDSENAVKVAEDQVRDWLRTKLRTSRGSLESAEWDGAGVFELGAGTTLTVVTLSDDRDQSARQLIRLEETNPTGRWIVSVTACSLPNARRDKQVLLIELQQAGVSVDDALREARPPRLVRNLLESTLVRDSSTVLSPSPIVVREDNIDEVLSAIADAGRSASVVVASSPGQVSDQRWQSIVGQLMRDSVGVATAFVIADSAVELLSRLLPSSHAVPRGAVRTFAPKVDLEDPQDGIRHRILGAATFARSINNGRVSGLLPIVHAHQARRRLVELELPADLRRSTELLVREDARITREARIGQMALAPSPELETPKSVNNNVETRPARGRGAANAVADWTRRAIAGLISRWTGATDVSLESVALLDSFIARNADGYSVAREQIESLLASKSGLQGEIDRLREQVEEAELSARIDSDEARKASREARILRERLQAAEQYADAFVEPEEAAWEPPDNIEEFILRLTPGVSDVPVVARVEFTGDESSALEIDKRDPFGRVVAKMWEFVLILHDYAELRTDGRFQGSVHQYLNDSATIGRKCSPQRHAAGESESVMGNARMSRERVFPVPKQVDRSGQMMMTAHFKPTHSDSFAPRLYYFDDTAGTGKIYVGYVGRHLTNTRTN
ncbi:hypothetical protein [Cryobacterium sp. TMT2-14]|uniref:hypothetical protein n=1 Tax=Cryobacterium sp. TMT2-14 TaxID=1259245 RepID=UPI00106AA0A5|nr:hypothetical protein [Cryobacterium sp. TMT2-14]TFC38969.1 hypothetical protein E3O28_03815 [Cryobacterium sp. TMT2-14]